MKIVLIASFLACIPTLRSAETFLELVSKSDSSKTELLLTFDELIAYQERDHIFEVNDKATAQLTASVGKSGFLWAAGVRQYNIIMPLRGSSTSHSGVVIRSIWNVEKKKYLFQICLGYPEASYFLKGVDPRDNKDLIEGLRRANKIGRVK